MFRPVLVILQVRHKLVNCIAVHCLVENIRIQFSVSHISNDFIIEVFKSIKMYCIWCTNEIKMK
jgi:hypothetical protein